MAELCYTTYQEHYKTLEYSNDVERIAVYMVVSLVHE